MSSRRTSLFSRRYAISRKAALTSLPEGRLSIRQDAEGFDDLDEYFSPSPVKNLDLAKLQVDYKEGVRVRSRGATPIKKIFEDNRTRSPRTGHWHEEEVPINHGDDLGQENDYIEQNSPILDTYSNNPLGNLETADENQPPALSTNIVNSKPKLKTKTYQKKGVISTRSSAPSTPASHARRAPGRPPSTNTATNKFPTTGTARRKSRLDYLVDVNKALAGGTGAPTISTESGIAVRRSKRSRIAPLAFWKNEKVIYGRRLSTKMPVIVDVVRKQEEAEMQKTAAGRKRKLPPNTKREGNKKGKSKKLIGAQSNLKVTCSVIDYETREKVERCTHSLFVILMSFSIGIRTRLCETHYGQRGKLFYPNCFY